MNRLPSVLLALVCLLLVLPINLVAQSNIDSLLQVRASEVHDTVKVRADVHIGRFFENSDFDSALYYYQRALELAKSGRMSPYPFFKGMVLENMGFAYIYGKGQTLLGISYLKKALSGHIAAGLTSAASKTEYNIGFFYGSMASYDSALFHYNQVINRHKGSSRMDRLHESYNNAGITYFYKAQFALSAQYLTRAIKLKEQSGETHEIHHTYMNLGTSFSNLGEDQRAKQYFMKANAINQALGNKDALATGLRNIAETLIDEDSLEVAMTLLDRARKLSGETGDQIGISLYYNGMGAVFEKSENYEEAIKNYQLAYDNFTSTVNDRYSSSVMTSLGRTKLKWSEENRQLKADQRDKVVREVITLAEEAWKRALRSDLINRKRSAAEVLKLAYEKTGEYRKALQFADSAYVLTNLINSRDQSQAIAFATTEYETEKVEGENALLQETQKAQEARLKQQNLVIFGAIVMLVLILTIGAVIYRSRLKLKKANEEIEQSLSEKELLLKEIHHRVKNNLQVVSSLLDLQSRGIEDEEALTTFMEGQNRVKAMALIHQKLYQNDNLATIDFAEYAENLMKELANLYPSAKEVKTTVQTTGNARFDIDTAVPLGLILNELISNAYKYAFNGSTSGQLNVSVEALGEGKHQLTVADSGAGLPEGFDFKKAKSMGLRLVRRLAKQLYGSVEYVDESGAMFIVYFSETQLRRAV